MTTEELKELLAHAEPGPWKLDDWAVYIHIGDTDQKIGMVRGYGRLREQLAVAKRKLKLANWKMRRLKRANRRLRELHKA